MFPLQLQARMAETWLNAATGNAWYRPAASWTTMLPWSSPVASAYAMPWPWTEWTGRSTNGFGAWPFGLQTAGEQWLRAFNFMPAFAVWPFSPPAAWDPHSSWALLFSQNYMAHDVTRLFWPWLATEAALPALSTVSYRTASGYAAASIFNGFELPKGGAAYAWPALAMMNFFAL